MSHIKCFVILGIITLICGNCSNRIKCAKLHEGTFKNVDETSGITYITRRSDIQTEVNNGYTVKLKVNWLNDCKYTLKLIEALEIRPGLPIDTSLMLTVEIVEVKENSYLQRTTDNKSDFVYESEIFFD